MAAGAPCRDGRPELKAAPVFPRDCDRRVYLNFHPICQLPRRRQTISAEPYEKRKGALLEAGACLLSSPLRLAPRYRGADADLQRGGDFHPFKRPSAFDHDRAAIGFPAMQRPRAPGLGRPHWRPGTTAPSRSAVEAEEKSPGPRPLRLLLWRLPTRESRDAPFAAVRPGMGATTVCSGRSRARCLREGFETVIEAQIALAWPRGSGDRDWAEIPARELEQRGTGDEPAGGGVVGVGG